MNIKLANHLNEQKMSFCTQPKETSIAHAQIDNFTCAIDNFILMNWYNGDFALGNIKQLKLTHSR